MLPFTQLYPNKPEDLGYLPQFLSVDDPRPAREQFHSAYRHGGGWQPFEGFEFNPHNYALYYPGDPFMLPVAAAKLRQETILVYPYSWVLILQPTGEWEIARMD